MPNYTSKNYREQGGDVWVIGGKLILIAPNGKKFEVKVSNTGELSAAEVV